MTDLKSSILGLANIRIKRISTDAVTRAIHDPRPTAGRPGWPPPACLHPPPTSELECSNNNRGTDGEIMVTRPRRAGHRGGTLSTITDKLIWALPGPGPPCSGPPGAGLPMVTSQMLWVCYYTAAAALDTGHLGNAKHCRKLTLVLTSYPQLFVSRQFL